MTISESTIWRWATISDETGTAYTLSGGNFTDATTTTLTALGGGQSDDTQIKQAIAQNDIIILDGTNGDFTIEQVMKIAEKNIDAADAEDGSQVNDRKCYVNVSGTNYCHKDAEGNEAADLKLYPEANVIEFGLNAGTYTFQKYSGTGNIMISSIEFTPVNATGISTINAAEKVSNGAIYNLAGQKVGKDFKGLVIKNGKKMIQ